MNRREFVQGVGAAGFTLMAGGCGLTQSPPPHAAKVHRIGYVTAGGGGPSAQGQAAMAAFRQGLSALGYVEGQNLSIDERYADGLDEIAEPAAELIRLQMEVILASAGPGARIVQSLSTSIPIVIAGQSDVMASGLIASLARPGGNVTGLSTPSLGGKQLQLFREALPTLSRVAVLYEPTGSVTPERLEADVHDPALQLQFLAARSAADLEGAFEAAVGEHADGLLALSSPVLGGSGPRIAELALESRLPSMLGYSASGNGGLLAYGANRLDLYRRAATYVDKIIRGASPSELPVELPLTFDFVINLKTAEALGLTISPEMLVQATEIIQ